jgi:hypothetical protein
VTKYIASYDEERWPAGNSYETREDAIKYGPDGDGCDAAIMWTGRPEHYVPNVGVFAGRLIEALSEQAFEEVGDFCEDWPAATQQQEDELAKALQAVVMSWLEATSHLPTFFRVVDVKEHRRDVAQKCPLCSKSVIREDSCCGFNHK